jgi:predicted transcriptional regulator
LLNIFLQKKEKDWQSIFSQIKGRRLSLRKNEISERVKAFIFLHVDSVELLDVLLLILSYESKSWDVQTISDELRSTTSSVKQKIQILETLGLVYKKDTSSLGYIYKPANAELNEIIIELMEAYRVQKHSILALIFSPMKKARDFADAFRKKDEGSNG